MTVARDAGMLAAVRRYLGPPLVAVAGLLLMALIIATGPEIHSEGVVPSPPTVQVVEARVQTMRMVVAAHGVVAPKTAAGWWPRCPGVSCR